MLLLAVPACVQLALPKSESVSKLVPSTTIWCLLTLGSKPGQPLPLLNRFMPAMSSTSFKLSLSVLAVVSVARSMRSTLAMRLPVSGLLAAWLATRLRSRLALPLRRMVSMPAPPSMRESCAVLPPAPNALCKAVTVLLPRINVSSPVPPYSTSAPLAVRVSLPALPTRVWLPVDVCVSSPVVPSQSTAVLLPMPVVAPKMT